MNIWCKILTLGRHWWTYGRHPISRKTNVHCRLCGKAPGNQWKIYKRKFNKGE